MKRSRLVLGLAVLMLAAGPSPLRAQGAIDELKCPGADGNGGGANDRFTYQSWVDLVKEGRFFRRCIQNEAKKAIWTDWKGLLGATWIDVGRRLYGSTFISDGQVAPGGTDLWWGDAQNQRLKPEAKCYRGEDACKAGKQAATSDPGPSILTVSFDATPQIEATVKTKQDFVVRTYQEFYLPRDPSAPSQNLGKLGLIVSSRLSQGTLSYTVSVIASRAISEWEGDEFAFRLASPDKAVMNALRLESVRPTIATLRALAQVTSAPPTPLVTTPATKPEKLVARVAPIDIVGPKGATIASLPISVLIGP